MAEQLAEALAAALGGSFSKGVLYPMDIIKNNLQAVKAASEKLVAPARPPK